MKAELEKDKLPIPDDWINDSLFTHQLYPQKNYLLVHSYLHHLINLSELRDIVQEQPIDAVLLGKLRDNASVFVTMGKTTANHLPLPRSEFKNENFTYQIGEIIHECRTIVPATHNSPNFLASNSRLLPVSDFRDEFVITEITTNGLQTRAIENDLKIPTSIARKISEHPLGIAYEYAFEETENGEPWALRIFNDTIETNIFWIETMVDTSEFGEGRANTTPFLTRIKADSDDIQMLISQLEISFNKKQSEFDKRKIIYYLTSVIYFQSEVNKPYLPETVVPRYLNPDLPNIYNILIRSPLAEIPDLISQCVTEKDGLLALKQLAELSGSTNLDFSKIQSKLKEFFGDQYSVISELLINGIRNLAENVQRTTSKELAQTSNVSSEFLQEWSKQKFSIISSIGRVFGIQVNSEGDEQYNDVVTLCDLDRKIELAESEISSDDELEIVMKGLISELMITSFINYIKISIKDSGYKPKTHLLTFQNIWEKIRNTMKEKYGRNPEDFDASLLGRSEIGVEWKKRFPDAIAQIVELIP